jgi:hypothetical protein
MGHEAPGRDAGTLRRGAPWQEPSLATATKVDDGEREAPGAKRHERGR